MGLLVLISLVVALLGQRMIIATIATAKVASGLEFPTEVGLDRLLAGGVLGGDI
jgi:hypothetical protein